MIRGDWIKPSATVIDVGINRIPAPERAKARPGSWATIRGSGRVAGAHHARPRGVGPMTIACLLANTVTTASLINGLAPPKDLTP